MTRGNNFDFRFYTIRDNAIVKGRVYDRGTPLCHSDIIEYTSSYQMEFEPYRTKSVFPVLAGDVFTSITDAREGLENGICD
jgi:hypothetical protein